MMERKKITEKEAEVIKLDEDLRGKIFIIKDLMDCEMNILTIKEDYARGGCIHPDDDEYFVVIKGKIMVNIGGNIRTVSQGDSMKIPKGKAHMFLAMKDSIVSEWGVKDFTKTYYDESMRKAINSYNETKRKSARSGR